MEALARMEPPAFRAEILAWEEYGLRLGAHARIGCLVDHILAASQAVEQ